MNKELSERIKGLESIIQCLHINNKFINYITFDTYNQPFNLSSNNGLYWIWINIMGIQMLDFYKVLRKQEKFSFYKLINLAKEYKVEMNYDELEKRTSSLIEKYNKTNFESIRSKYLAHQDLDKPNLRANLRTVGKMTHEVKTLYSFFCKEFEYNQTEYSNVQLDSFKEIFETIEEHMKVKELLISEHLEGATNIKISKLQKIIRH
jgi:hypothetical protein